jgi:hypothetical protein
MGYHKVKIEKGILGEFSKIKEEFEELSDGVQQENPVLIIVELCDMIGAIEAYAANWNLTLDDLVKMKNATKSAFEDGTRN